MTDDAKFLALVAILIEIRDAVLALSQEVITETSDECEHPAEERISLATPGDPLHWICNACHYENRSGAPN